MSRIRSELADYLERRNARLLGELVPRSTFERQRRELAARMQLAVAGMVDRLALALEGVAPADREAVLEREIAKALEEPPFALSPAQRGS